MKRRWILLVVLAFVGAAGCSSKPVTIRVMTYNIRHGEGMDKVVDLERIAEVIKSAKPDLVALQEVDRGVPRTASVDESEVLGGLCRMHPVFERNADMQGGDYGNAVLSRYPIESHVNYHLPRFGNNEQRGLLEVHVRVGGKPVTFFATHLDHQKDDAERMASVEKLRDLVAQQRGAVVILAADLNAEPDTRVIKAVGEFLHTSCDPADLATLSFPADKPTRRIDYIMYNDGREPTCVPFIYDDDPRLTCVKSEVLPEPVASDHRPVVTEFKFNPGVARD